MVVYGREKNNVLVSFIFHGTSIWIYIGQTENNIVGLQKLMLNWKCNRNKKKTEKEKKDARPGFTFCIDDHYLELKVKPRECMSRLAGSKPFTHNSWWQFLFRMPWRMLSVGWALNWSLTFVVIIMPKLNVIIMVAIIPQFIVVDVILIRICIVVSVGVVAVIIARIIVFRLSVESS